MSVQEMKCGESGSPEALSPERLITYRRRKRAEQTMREPNGTALCFNTYNQDGLARIDRHWRNTLENMLHLPGVYEGCGIQSCLQDALTSGPFGYTGKSRIINVLEDSTQPEARCKGYYKVKGPSERLDSSPDATSEGSRTESHSQADVHANTMKCQKVFLDILLSEKFALLCDLLCQNFEDGDSKKMLDFSLINSKMKNGVYEQSARLFYQDIQQVWQKFHKVGQEMILLASSLTNISQASYQKQVGEGWVHEASEQKYEASDVQFHNLLKQDQLGDELKNSMDSCTMTLLSERSTKPDQTEASFLYKVLNCKHCGAQADGKQSLICDGCEAMYHVSCIEPTVQGIPNRSWYCASCSTSKRVLSEHLLSDDQKDSLHQDCVVCDRLEISDMPRHLSKSDKETVMTDDSRESSVSSMEYDEPLEPSRTAILRLCKQCGTCEDDDKRFLICGNTHCFYKFYHIRCLRSSQIASQQQQNQHCWYCPSCLCRACLSDKDDDKIVMCDGCDEAYHIYCMKPPRTSIPKGNWYCTPCNVKRAREGMRKYEQWILQKHSDKDLRQVNGAKRSVDVLLSAAEKLSSEERL